MKRLIAATAVAMLWALPASAQQQAICFPFQKAIKAAFDTFKEVPAFVFVTEGGGVMTLTVAEDGNWTLWIQADEKNMCIVASGEGFTEASDAMKKLAVPGVEAAL